MTRYDDKLCGGQLIFTREPTVVQGESFEDEVRPPTEGVGRFDYDRLRIVYIEVYYGSFD